MRQLDDAGFAGNELLWTEVTTEPVSTLTAQVREKL
jgi:hypothetical protein